MIKNVLFCCSSPSEICITSFEDARELQFDSYCRADYYQLIWIKEGSATFEIDMKSVKLVSDNYICISKDMVYKFDSESKYSGYILSFTDYYFTRSEQDIVFLQSARIFKTPLEQMKLPPMAFGGDLISIDHIEYLLTKANDAKDPFRSDVVHIILKLILYRLETSIPGDYQVIPLDQNQIYVRDFKQLVNEHFIEHKELSFYTEQLGISSKQLLSATKQVLGKNSKEVIIEKTIIEAKRFLSYSGLSVKQIAYCLGFNEPNNFSIFFNKYTNLTPGAFKKDVLDASLKTNIK